MGKVYTNACTEDEKITCLLSRGERCCVSDLSGSLERVYTNEYAGEQNTWLLSKGERCWVPDLSGSLERVYASTYIPGNRQCGFNSEESIP